MYSSYPHIARSFNLKELTVLFKDWNQNRKVICGKIRYQRKTDDCPHEVAFKLLTEELDQNGFPKLHLDWGLKSSVYDLSACIEGESQENDKMDSEAGADIIEAFGIAVIHTTSEITTFNRQQTTHIQPSLGHA